MLFTVSEATVDLCFFIFTPHNYPLLPLLEVVTPAIYKNNYKASSHQVGTVSDVGSNFVEPFLMQHVHRPPLGFRLAPNTISELVLEVYQALLKICGTNS